jgi:hypothetical protein
MVSEIPNKSRAEPSLFFGLHRAKGARYSKRKLISMLRALAVASLVPGSGCAFTATNIPLLDYTPEQGQFQAPAAGTSLLPPPSIDPSGLSLFTALQERLGLKLEPGKGPVDILVIDHVERPSES